MEAGGRGVPGPGAGGAGAFLMFSLFVVKRAAQLADAHQAWRSAARCSNPRLLPPSPRLLHVLQRMSPQKPRLRRAGGCSGACGRELVPPGPEAQPQVRVQGWWERGRGVSRAVTGRPRTGEALDTGGDEPRLAPGPSSSHGSIREPSTAAVGC